MTNSFSPSIATTPPSLYSLRGARAHTGSEASPISPANQFSIRHEPEWQSEAKGVQRASDSGESAIGFGSEMSSPTSKCMSYRTHRNRTVNS